MLKFGLVNLHLSTLTRFFCISSFENYNLVGHDLQTFSHSNYYYYLVLYLQAKQGLQYQPTELKTSIIDMAYNLIDLGFVKMTPRYKEVKKVE